ncbi:MAG: ribosome small subunit-dependent GTPase A [Candidatus Latescibacterota bacterium]
MRGRVLRVSGLQHLVEVDGRPWQCEIRGRLKEGARRTTSPVIVGDWVEVEPTGAATGVIAQVHPRLSRFSRGASGLRPYEQVIAVNLDQLVVVAAIRQPALRPGFIDRAVVMALRGGLVPVVCINKVDLDETGEAECVAAAYGRLGYQAIITSARTGQGVDLLRQHLERQVSAVVGQSGVGKSSLLNQVEPGLSIKTQSLMRQHDRGRHTTAAVHLYRLRAGGYVADTPGIKELRLWGVAPCELVTHFAEMAPLADHCAFRNCSHVHEPGCAVRAAVGRGDVSALRYQGYCRIMESLELRP